MKSATGYAGRIFLWASVLTFVALPVGRVHAAPCSLTTFFGTYGVLVHGTPASKLEHWTADGAGNRSGSATIAINDVVQQNVPVSGTYSILPNCTGTISLVGGETHNLVLSLSGEEVQVIQTNDPTAAETGDGKRTDLATCTNLSFKGFFGANRMGEVGGLYYSALDQENSSGTGALRDTGTVAFNGAITPETLTGQYMVNPDCSGSVTLSNGITENLVIVSKGAEVLSLRTDNPTAQVTGDAKSLSH